MEVEKVVAKCRQSQSRECSRRGTGYQEHEVNDAQVDGATAGMGVNGRNCLVLGMAYALGSSMLATIFIKTYQQQYLFALRTLGLLCPSRSSN
jgi:hypothetical protein